MMSGFKLQSREIMEMDLGNAVLQAATSEDKKTFENPNAKTVNNIITTITGYMGINLDTQREFIINNTVSKLEASIPSEGVYIEQSEQYFKKKGKHLPSYEHTFNQTLLFLSLMYIIVAIQTAIPSVRTRKTHPGCKRSFIGYPLDGSDDLSSISYMACIAHKIKSSISPWNTIKKMKEVGITTRLKALMDKYVINNDLMLEKMKEKSNYLQQTEPDLIPIEHDIDKWINFLPPLKEIKGPMPTNISEGFKTQLLDDLKRGSPDQFEKINVVQAKIIYFSLAVQQLIQKIVSKEKPLITNSNLEPFLENTCCHSEEFDTLSYFIEKDRSIAQYNEITNNLNNILVDMVDMAKAPIIFNPQNTKIPYPVLSTEFSEETIYRAFIVFCKFNKSVLVDESLRAICMDKPDAFNINDSIDEKIASLKRDGRNYSEEALQQLLLVINKKNIVKLNLHDAEVTIIQRLRDILIYLRETSDPKYPKHYVLI